jgi:hypothetical protein
LGISDYKIQAMGKLVVIKIGDGNLEKLGLPVTLYIGEEGDPFHTSIEGKLPPSMIEELYEKWQLEYRKKVSGRMIAAPAQVKNGSDSDLRESSNLLKQELNNWLNSETFRPIKDKFQQKLNTDENVRVIIQTENPRLWRLPWYLWDLFEPPSYRFAEVAISSPAFERVENSVTPKPKVRILAILGDSSPDPRTGIRLNINADKQFLESLADAETVFLVEPNRQNFNEQLRDEQGWDILFFAGHSSSQSDATTGEMSINTKESLTITDLKFALQKAIERGLQLAIFNSCDGLGIARDLAELQIPQIIVMREPVPDLVAQYFLKYFLSYFSSGKALYLAVREAREWLQGVEKESPCVSWLPVIYQNPAIIPPTWEELRGIEAERQGLTINPLTTIQELTTTEQEVKIREDLESTNPEIFKDAAKKKLQQRLDKLFLINESLILDPSYITCAEYQLFIDEKQKIGKNHQPDHWKSYRFFPGNSIDPIAGIRASDAEEFCQWLNEQYCEPGQKYRLPSQYEVEKYPAIKQQIGCWCSTEVNYKIIGIEPEQLQTLQQQISQLIKSERTLKNYNKFLQESLLILGIDYQQSWKLACDINLKGITEIALKHEPNLSHLTVTELTIKIDLIERAINEFNLKLSSANDIARTCNINLNNDLKHIPDFNLKPIIEKIAPKIDDALLQEIKRECKRELSEFTTDFNPSRTCYYLLLVYAIWQLLSAIYKEADRESNIIKLLTRWWKSEKRLSDEYAKLRDETFNLYTLFLLLHERRKGNIIAWEGIRIVREKI